MNAGSLTDFSARPKRPPLARVLNAAGRGLDVLGLAARPALTVDSVEAAACQQAGSDDFGSDSHRAALEPLLYALEYEADLNQLGRLVLRGQIVSALASRLAVVAWEKANPKAAAAPVEAPLIIVGMPRTGTTILYEMLAAAPGYRAPLTWECRDYALAHAIKTPRTDKRIVKLGKAMSRMDRLMPGFSAIHYFDPFIPTECVGLTNLDLCSEQYPALAWAPTYRDFLLSTDFRSAYAWHKRGLRYFQSTTPSAKWVLKTPMHSAYLKTLLETYPDACLIHTHRDPMTVIASVCSLCATGRRGWSDRRAVAEQAEADAVYIAEITRSAARFRIDHPEFEDRFCDVAFKDFMADPMSEIDRIFVRFARSPSAEQRSAMAAYLEARPRNKYGTHRYSLDQFGLDPTDIRPLFSDYLDRFGAFV